MEGTPEPLRGPVARTHPASPTGRRLVVDSRPAESLARSKSGFVLSFSNLHEKDAPVYCANPNRVCGKARWTSVARGEMDVGAGLNCCRLPACDQHVGGDGHAFAIDRRATNRVPDPQQLLSARNPHHLENEFRRTSRPRSQFAMRSARESSSARISVAASYGPLCRLVPMKNVGVLCTSMNSASSMSSRTRFTVSLDRKSVSN